MKTDINGYYEFYVKFCWSGEVRAEMPGVTFINNYGYPYYSYYRVAYDFLDQDFRMN